MFSGSCSQSWMRSSTGAFEPAGAAAGAAAVVGAAAGFVAAAAGAAVGAVVGLAAGAVVGVAAGPQAAINAPPAAITDPARIERRLKRRVRPDKCTSLLLIGACRHHTRFRLVSNGALIRAR